MSKTRTDYINSQQVCSITVNVIYMISCLPIMYVCIIYHGVIIHVISCIHKPNVCCKTFYYMIKTVYHGVFVYIVSIHNILYYDYHVIRYIYIYLSSNISYFYQGYCFLFRSNMTTL